MGTKIGAPTTAWLWLGRVMAASPSMKECEARSPEELQAACEWAQSIWRKTWRGVGEITEKPQWIADWEAAQKEGAKDNG